MSRRSFGHPDPLQDGRRVKTMTHGVNLVPQNELLLTVRDESSDVVAPNVHTIITDDGVLSIPGAGVARIISGIETLVATEVGQVLISVDGETFEARMPLTNEAGWMISDEGYMLVTG